MKMSKLFKGDKTLWVVFLLLSIISLVEVYSSIGLEAYTHENSGGPTRLFLRHLLIVLASWIIVIVCSRINYRFFSRFAVIGLWASVVLLAVTLMIGGRWLPIPVVNQFQPSEVAKIALVLFIARMLTLKKDQAGEKNTFFYLLAFIVLVVFFVLPENFSTAALLFVSCYLMLFFGGVDRRLWWIVLLAMMVVAAIGLGIAINKSNSDSDNKHVIERTSTWVNRIKAFSEDPDPTVITQENMARMAIAGGGVFGKGPGNTTYARLMTQSHNDFIYAIIIEETGLVGGILVLVLYSFFFFRCMRLAWRANGRFGALVAAGLGTMIYLQAMANMGVAVGVLPVTGQTLPFISYGGTAYLFLGLGLGIIQSVAADVYSKKEVQEVHEVQENAEDNEEMTITDDTDMKQ